MDDGDAIEFDGKMLNVWVDVNKFCFGSVPGLLKILPAAIQHMIMLEGEVGNRSF